VITDVPGVQVGHWTDAVGQTGCTVVLFPDGSVASGEVRGGAPGTYDFDRLAPERHVPSIDAVVLTGGSAFGLASCTGVARWCEEHDRGIETVAGRVPLVVGMVIFDLAVGDPKARPDAAAGYAACEAASGGAVEMGRVGGGTGATVNKWQGREHKRPAGIGTATERDGDVIVSALAVVNAFGDLRPASGPRPAATPIEPSAAFENTTIGVIATNARFDKRGCHLIAQSGHDGLARALEPVHTLVDGDALVAVSAGGVQAELEHVRLLAARALESAVRAAVPS
jgi:L-aminopeptidase/D-esterase-like protein